VDPVEALTQLGGVATLAELTQALTRHQVRHAVAGGRIEHLRRDTYVLPGLDEARRAAICAGGVLGGVGAAQYWGWKVRMPPDRPCVVLPRNARRPAGDLECHWQGLGEDDVVDGVTGRVATVVCCARWYDVPTALSVADSALREGVVTREQLLAAAEASPRTGRAKVLAVVAAADARAANPFESCLRAHALDVPGLHLEAQGCLPGIGVVDLLDGELGSWSRPSRSSSTATRRASGGTCAATPRVRVAASWWCGSPGRRRCSAPATCVPPWPTSSSAASPGASRSPAEPSPLRGQFAGRGAGPRGVRRHAARTARDVAGVAGPVSGGASDAAPRRRRGRRRW
jgi:hypothetical protein